MSKRNVRVLADGYLITGRRLEKKMQAKIRNGGLALIAAGLMVVASAATAAPISFVVSNAAMTWGAGYGVDNK
ncbi:hypothetical protein [Thauera humireducens]|uniref:hypothetical protein n=1 Tax=Thauera humireducens TaxID=1134435 RepID=UPI000A43FED0|nr:hypothetical protein [Thauera humireducens]